MPSVPKEICFEILLRVPAKSTYVCKCVCKSWFQIISNPSFAKMHLNNAIRRKNYNFILQSSYECGTEWHSTVNSICYDSLSSVNGSKSEMVAMVGYPFSFTHKWKYIKEKDTGSSLRVSAHKRIKTIRTTTSQLELIYVYPFSSYSDFRFLGSCHGLVCLWYACRPDRSFCICNPATKEYKRIPKSRHDYWKNRNITQMNNAFGYDCKADDYKLITLVEYQRTEILDVYTLGTNSWGTSQTVPYKFPIKQQTGVLVNGAFHWFGTALEYNSPKLIVSMDISNQKFDEVQLPEELSLLENKHASMTIGVLEGCLCSVVLISAIRYEVWMMRDYKVKESWSQLYIIDDKVITGAGFTLKMMWSFENGQILLKYGNGIVIFDPKHSRGTEPKIFSTLRIHDAVSYVESLVSLNSGTYARRNKMVGK